MTSRSGTSGTRERRAGSAEPDDAADAVVVARNIVLRQLTVAPRTRAELAEALRKRNVPDDAAREVLDRCAELGYIDDAALAATWARARLADRGLGRRAVAASLRQRGVDGEHVDAALADLSAEDEEEAARRLVRKRVARSSGLSREVLRRRLLAMLARKGHSSAVALRIVRDELDRAGVPSAHFPHPSNAVDATASERDDDAEFDASL